MAAAVSVRPAVNEDIPAAYAMFRRSIYDYLFRLGMVDAEEAKDPPIATAWRRQSSWIEHLWTTAAENWVALDEADRLIGWALSIERESHLELAFFFVDPGVQGKGLGKTLIERAMPRGPRQPQDHQCDAGSARFVGLPAVWGKAHCHIGRCDRSDRGVPERQRPVLRTPRWL